MTAYRHSGLEVYALGVSRECFQPGSQGKAQPMSNNQKLLGMMEGIPEGEGEPGLYARQRGVPIRTLL